jgi:hypothetical protein
MTPRRTLANYRKQLNMAGDAEYKAAPEKNELVIALPAGGCVVFLIQGKFTLDDSSGSIRGSGEGHVIEGSTTLTLGKAAAVVIISS